MTIEAIKAQINKECGSTITTLLMVQQKEEVEGVNVPTPWHTYWDNSSRVRVVMHTEVLDAIKQDKQRQDLVIKKEVVQAEGTRALYVRYCIVVPGEISGVF